MRSIGIEKYRINEYVNLNVYFLGKIDNKKATAYVTKKAYIINGLKANIFVEINLLVLKGFVINFVKKKITIFNYKNIIIKLTVTPRNNERI